MKSSLVVLLLSFLTRESRGSAWLEVRALSFKNEHGTDESGNSCDYGLEYYCDYKFNFCLLDGDACLTTVHTDVYWDKFVFDFDTQILKGGVTNPMRFNFPGDYPGNYCFKTVVVDDDNGPDKDNPVDTLTTCISTAPGVTSQQELKGERHSNPTSLNLAFSVRCDTYFYGESCNVYCQDTNSESGHYTCGPSGERVCLEGWTNPSQHCLTATCSEGCAHGYCNRPNQCICRAGYSGPLCTQAVCNGGCGQGTCTRPGVCSCKEGFNGRKCNEPVCREGCKYGSCNQPGDCQCTPGYQGNLCDQRELASEKVLQRCEELVDNCVSGVCLNGGECVNAHNSFSCRCAEGFTGEFCGVNIDDCASKPCYNNGVCRDKIADYECACPDKVDGSQPPKNCSGPPCSYIFCQNNGTCTDSEGFGVCTCPPGFSGLYCESTPSATDDPPDNDGDDQFSAMVYIFIGIGIGLIVASLVWVYVLFWRNSKCPTLSMSGKTMRGYCEKVKNYFKQGSHMRSSDKTNEDKSFLIHHEDLAIPVEDLSTVESGED